MNTRFLANPRRKTILMAGGAAIAGLLLLSGLPHAAEQSDNPASSPQIVAAARGVVDVEGGIVRISPPRDGVVVAVNVHEGSVVRVGDVLAQLDSKQETLAARISQDELMQSRRQLQLMQLKEKSSSRQLERLRRAAASDAVSKQALDEANDAHAALAVELEMASSAVEIAQFRQGMAEHEAELRTIRAPVDGVIVRQSARVGEAFSTQAMTELFSILPDKAKIIRAEIPEEFLGAIAPDVPVEIVTDNNPAAPFAGTVVRVSPVLTQAKRGETNDERSDIRTASAIIRVDGNVPLTVGQRVVIKTSK